MRSLCAETIKKPVSEGDKKIIRSTTIVRGVTESAQLYDRTHVTMVASSCLGHALPR